MISDNNQGDCHTDNRFALIEYLPPDPTVAVRFPRYQYFEIIFGSHNLCISLWKTLPLIASRIYHNGKSIQRFRDVRALYRMNL